MNYARMCTDSKGTSRQHQRHNQCRGSERRLFLYRCNVLTCVTYIHHALCDVTGRYIYDTISAADAAGQVCL